MASAPSSWFEGATVLANITMGPVLELLARLVADGLRPPRLVVAGILSGEQEAAVVQAARDAGWRPASRVYETEWVSMDLRRTRARSGAASAGEGLSRAAREATHPGPAQGGEPRHALPRAPGGRAPTGASGRGAGDGGAGRRASDGAAPGVGERKARKGTSAPAPIAGLVVRRGRNLEVEPLFQKGPSSLPTREGVKLQAGDLVLYTWAPGNKVRVVRVIGKKGVLADVIEALLLDNLIERGFSAAVLAEAVEAADLESRRDTYRVDLRDLFTFTVDPETARDFDDALSFEPGDDGVVTVFVHIADVCYYVVEGTALDEEALRRTTSVYVSTGVEPMLPPLLSSGVCSLQPGVDRKTVTVECRSTRRDACSRCASSVRSSAATGA